jgi:hypothetical protein
MSFDLDQWSGTIARPNLSEEDLESILNMEQQMVNRLENESKNFESKLFATKKLNLIESNQNFDVQSLIDVKIMDKLQESDKAISENKSTPENQSQEEKQLGNMARDFLITLN